jgi:hypothetical protein
MAIALRSGLERPLSPTKLLSAPKVGFAQVAAGKLVAADRVLFRLITQPEFDGVHFQVERECVHGALDGESSDRFAGRSHEGVGDAVDGGDLLAMRYDSIE